MHILLMLSFKAIYFFAQLVSQLRYERTSILCFQARQTASFERDVPAFSVWHSHWPITASSDMSESISPSVNTYFPVGGINFSRMIIRQRGRFQSQPLRASDPFFFEHPDENKVIFVIKN